MRRPVRLSVLERSADRESDVGCHGSRPWERSVSPPPRRSTGGSLRPPLPQTIRRSDSLFRLGAPCGRGREPIPGAFTHSPDRGGARLARLARSGVWILLVSLPRRRTPATSASSWEGSSPGTSTPTGGSRGTSTAARRGGCESARCCRGEASEVPSRSDGSSAEAEEPGPQESVGPRLGPSRQRNAPPIRTIRP